MAERPEDLNLPVTVVQRIIKESLPDGVIVSKEARQTISRASSVFVLYLTACAVTHANKAKRKTLAVKDILSAISDMEFDLFIEPLNEALKNRKDMLPQQSSTSRKSSDGKAGSKTANEDMDEEGDNEDSSLIEVDGEAEAEMEEDAEGDDKADEVEGEAESAKTKKRKVDKKSGDVNELDELDN